MPCRAVGPQSSGGPAGGRNWKRALRANQPLRCRVSEAGRTLLPTPSECSATWPTPEPPSTGSTGSSEAGSRRSDPDGEPDARSHRVDRRGTPPLPRDLAHHGDRARGRTRPGRSRGQPRRRPRHAHRRRPAAGSHVQHPGRSGTPGCRRPDEPSAGPTSTGSPLGARWCRVRRVPIGNHAAASSSIPPSPRPASSACRTSKSVRLPIWCSTSATDSGSPSCRTPSPIPGRRGARLQVPVHVLRLIDPALRLTIGAYGTRRTGCAPITDAFFGRPRHRSRRRLTKRWSTKRAPSPPQLPKPLRRVRPAGCGHRPVSRPTQHRGHAQVIAGAQPQSRRGNNDASPRSCTRWKTACPTQAAAVNGNETRSDKLRPATNTPAVAPRAPHSRRGPPGAPARPSLARG